LFAPLRPSGLLRACASLKKLPARIAATWPGRSDRIAAFGEIGWPGLAPLFDMGMLVMLSGRESPVEYRHLFEAARLTATKVTETETHMVILEAVRA
jgi:hypothetical protein